MTLLQKAYTALTNVDFDKIIKLTNFKSYKLADAINNPRLLQTWTYSDLKRLASLMPKATPLPVRFYKDCEAFNSSRALVIYKVAQIKQDYHDLLAQYAKQFDLRIVYDNAGQTGLDNSLNIMYDRYYDFESDKYVYIVYNQSNKTAITNKLLAVKPTDINEYIGDTVDHIFNNLINHKLIKITKLYSKHILNTEPDPDFNHYHFGLDIINPANVTDYENEAMISQRPDTRKDEKNLDKYMLAAYHAKLI